MLLAYYGSRLKCGYFGFTEGFSSKYFQVSPDGRTVASGSWSCLIKLWDLEASNTTMLYISDIIVTIS